MSLVEEVQVFEQDYATAQNALDSILLKHPDINIVVFHFATMAEGADERAMALTTIDRENFAIISGDNNQTLLDRIKASRTGGSLVRGSGAYDVNGVTKLFGITMGEYNDEIGPDKRFVFATFPITIDNVDEFTANI
jgi:ABC-type sugar transport system substrate-binding protein